MWVGVAGSGVLVGLGVGGKGGGGLVTWGVNRGMNGPEGVTVAAGVAVARSDSSRLSPGQGVRSRVHALVPKRIKNNTENMSAVRHADITQS